MPVEADLAVLDLAGRQQGVVGAEQLAALGVGRHAVAHKVAGGWLRRVHRGIYLVGPLQTPHSLAMAATLAAGEGAVAGHGAAAVLWVLLPTQGGPIDVIVPGRKVRERPGIRVHRDDLHPADRTRRHGIPVTSPARTLLDLATTTTRRELETAINEAHVNRLVTDLSLNEQFSRYPRHRGTAALRAAQRIDPALTRSEAERRALDLIRAARLPAPEVNARVGPWEVDLLWRKERVIVEIDGYAFHSSRRSFERDRRKDRDLREQGYRVLRFTWRELTEEPEAVVAAITRSLAERRRA